MRKVFVALSAVVLAAGLGVGGFLLGARSERPGAASYQALQQGLAVALGMPVEEVQRGLDPFYRTRCPSDGAAVCQQIMYGPVAPPGTDMQQRLYDAGWVLHNHDEPECVSDGPDVRGWVCSYERDDVVISIQVESPTSPDELYLWASTG